MYRILIIEDDEGIAEAIKEHAERWQDWGAIHSQLEIFFSDRIPQ